MTKLFLNLMIIILCTSCSKIKKNDQNNILNDTWSIEILYLNNNELTQSLRNNTVYFKDDNTCSLPINRSKKTTWDLIINDGIYNKLIIKSTDYYSAEHETNNYFLGEYNLQFYESKSHLYLELYNDSVMFLLKSYKTILLQKRPVVVNSLPFEKFIPYPDFYNEYGLTDDFHFKWFKGEFYPRIDSNFLKLKKNYEVIKPILLDFMGHDSLTKAKSCFKKDYLSIEEVSIVLIDLLENHNINELENMNRDSCLYSEESINLVKKKIRGKIDSE